jgi:hypothetical protein
LNNSTLSAQNLDRAYGGWFARAGDAAVRRISWLYPPAEAATQLHSHV